jgi:hypothetical protein
VGGVAQQGHQATGHGVGALHGGAVTQGPQAPAQARSGHAVHHLLQGGVGAFQGMGQVGGVGGVVPVLQVCGGLPWMMTTRFIHSPRRTG